MFAGCCVGGDMFGKLIKWFKFSVASVPEDIAICEFDCDEQECRLQDWEHCERRLHASNAQNRQQIQ
jgi:hypothetical protein